MGRIYIRGEFLWRFNLCGYPRSACNVCAGNYWIYSTYGKFTEYPDEPTYCHPTLYWYAFWLMTAGYIILGVVIVGGCAITSGMICYATASSE